MLTLFALGALLFGVPALAPAVQTPAVELEQSSALPSLPAPIERVSLSNSGALVRRRARIEASGRYVIGPLPAALLERDLVLRLSGGQVGGLRLSEPKPNREDLAPLQDELQRLGLQQDAHEAREQRIRILRDGVLKRLEGLGQSPGLEPSAVDHLLAWAGDKLVGYDQEIEASRAESKPIRERISALEELLAQPRAPMRELELDVQLAGPEAASCELEYLVSDCRWTPLYDLRVSGFEAEPSLEIAFRAEIEQRTGEDWNGVALELSTARPDRGAARPSLPRWTARVIEPNRDPHGYSDGLALASEAPPPTEPERALEIWSVPGPSALPSGASRTVEIGRLRLPIAIEHCALPTKGAGVWRIGRLRYEGQRTLLPGLASVYLEGDYVGKADLPRRFAGEELELPLGLDPRLSIARAALVDKSQAPGLFGSRRRLDQRWRIELTAGPGRPVKVFVEEALPISNDSRVAVELLRGELAPSGDERFKKQREERGLLVFPLRVEPGSTARFEWGFSVSFPDRLELELAPGP